ncbi:hypothetical protein [Botrimarina sp.]|uniref:hypothetical protein n=1 Tax=Botrimarina sp. TaxID=2795802 RepID=UPI0032EC5B2D
MFQEGDIVEIPLPDGRTAIGWILHLSERFKHAVGFVVFGVRGRQSDRVVYDPDTGTPLSTRVLGPLYTHEENIELSGWIKLAHQPLSQRGRLLTKREVGGGVFIGDDYIGTVEEVGDSNVKPMLSMGMPVIYSEIENAFAVESQ